MIMKSIQFVLVCLLMILVSCSTYQKTTDASTENTPIKELVTSKQFEIISNYAKPMGSAAYTQVANSNLLGVGNSANNVNLAGNANYLRMHGDSISIELPFFGERQFGSINGDSGISFNGLYSDYKEKYNAKKELYTISFVTKKNTDRLQFTLSLYANLRSTIYVNSTNRSSISYDGRVATYPKQPM